MDVKVRVIISPGVRRLEAALQGRIWRSVATRMHSVARRAQKALEAYGAHWSDPPTFNYVGSPESGQLDIWTTNQLFLWLDDGVRPHVIFARKKYMVFSENYQAKTTPGRVLRGSGSYSGGLVYAKKVNHPGIRPRRFTRIVQEQTQRNMKREIEAAIKAATG